MQGVLSLWHGWKHKRGGLIFAARKGAGHRSHGAQLSQYSYFIKPTHILFHRNSPLVLSSQLVQNHTRPC